MEFIIADKKTITKNENGLINEFLLENNTKQVEDIHDFLQDNSKFLFINGFKGSGKNSLCNYVCNFLKEDVLRLDYKCFETTINDDILLVFFKQFRVYCQSNFIDIPKIKYENFAQKINAYFEIVKVQILITISSFDDVLKVNKPEITDFLKHLSKFENVKIIIITRKNQAEDFGLKTKKITVLGLEKSIFERYLRAENFKQTGPLTDELYKHTHGYFFLTTLAIKLMQHNDIDLFEFLDKFSKSLMTFNDYILREALSLINPVDGHLFRFLAIIRHPVNKNLLIKLHLTENEKLKFFTDNMLLSEIGNNYYLKSYYREIAENSIPDNVSIKLHQGCVDLYNTQLPLKPFERDIMVSRQTMRNEIDYHDMFIPHKTKPETEIQQKPAKIIEETPSVNDETSVEIKEEKIKKMSFIFDDDDSGVLDTIANSIETYISHNDAKLKQETEEKKYNLEKLLQTALKEEEKFNYKHACSLYTKALAKNNEPDFEKYSAIIHENLAKNNEKLSNWYEAEKYYNSAKEIYLEQNNNIKANEMLFNIANVYYNTFKKNLAVEIIDRLENAEITNEIKIRICNLISILKPSQAEKYYQRVLDINKTNISTSVLSEFYYRYALHCEYKEDIKTAVTFYKECINLGQKNNPYLADCYSNIAQLYDEIGQTNKAIEYFEESYKIDKTNSNFNGMYSSSIKLAEIFLVRDCEKSEYYYKNALEYAQKLGEDFYIISSLEALGNLYFDKKDYNQAVLYLKAAYKKVSSGIYQEYARKISLRIDDIKNFLGEEREN